MVYDARFAKLELLKSGFQLFSFPQKEDASSSFKDRLSNIAYAYNLDPAFGVQRIISDLKGTSENLFFARICEFKFYCDIFISVVREADALKIKLNSRILQTIYALPPVVARIEELKLQILCDDQPLSLPLVSTLGTDNNQNQNQTFFTPFEMLVKTHCSKFSLVALSTESISVNSQIIAPYKLGHTTFPISSIDSNYLN